MSNSIEPIMLTGDVELLGTTEADFKALRQNVVWAPDDDEPDDPLESLGSIAILWDDDEPGYLEPKPKNETASQRRRARRAAQQFEPAPTALVAFGKSQPVPMNRHERRAFLARARRLTTAAC